MKTKVVKRKKLIEIPDEPVFKRNLPKIKRELIEKSDEAKKRRVLKISIVEEAYRILNLPNNVKFYKVLKIDKDCMLISKTMNLEVTHRWNTNPGDMQPGSKVLKKNYCVLFIIAWHKPNDPVIIDLGAIGCPILKVTSIWDVDKAFKELDP